MPAPQNDATRWEVLARYLADEATPADAAAVEQWMAAAPSRRDLVEALAAATSRVRAPAPAGLDVEAALLSVRARLDEVAVVPLVPARERPSPLRRMNALRIAAAIALVLGATLVWQAVREPVAPPAVAVAAATWTTDAGRTESVRLPDGSTVLLGPLSRLTMAEGYGDGARSLELNGEAVFDVMHREDRPFIVRAGAGIVRDLGTVFAVRSVEAREVRVIVTEGSVRLQSVDAAPDAGIVLAAGEGGVLGADGVAHSTGSVSPADALGWTEGRLVFEEAPFERVRTDLHRWYDITLQVDDPGLETPPLTTTFENASRDEVLDLLRLVYGATIEERGDTAIMRRNR